MTDVAVHVRDYDDIRILILMCANTNPHVRNTDVRICAQVMRRSVTPIDTDRRAR